jgi:hypothetical protein
MARGDRSTDYLPRSKAWGTFIFLEIRGGFKERKGEIYAAKQGLGSLV